jgi:NAD(P)-dependent dehydrogenase (short-subunit alcohol dehydrogenase family)
MAGRVEGKVALVTGGGTGIGRGCATLLAREGAQVVVANRNAETGEETVRLIREAGGEAAFCRTDVSQVSDCERAVNFAVEKFGRLNVLVNNAALFPRATLPETTEELFDQLMGVNLKGPLFLCQFAVPIMQKQGKGSIINIGSIHGYGGAGMLLVYAMTKGGLLTMTKNLAMTYARNHVRVNYVIPGWVISEGEIRIQAQFHGRSVEDLAEISQRLPMGRHSKPEDAAYAVLYLASDESSMVTGCVINTDGGNSVRSIGADAR